METRRTEVGTTKDGVAMVATFDNGLVHIVGQYNGQILGVIILSEADYNTALTGEGEIRGYTTRQMRTLVEWLTIKAENDI